MTKPRSFFQFKSLVPATLLSMAVIVGISFFVFQFIANRMQRLNIDPMFDHMDEVQLESARNGFERHGKQGVIDYMSRLDRIYGGLHYLLDANGNDVVTGKDLRWLLPPPPATRQRIADIHGTRYIAHRSADGKYWFAVIGAPYRMQIWAFLPYYFLVLGVTAAIFWLAAVGVILPIRRIAGTIALFGHGDLTARVRADRPDEIGQLARSFNQMAERLERLIVSERQLLGDISHELRSPLARLKFATKLARTSPDPQSALDRIERDVDRIAALVADIVEVTFMEGDPALRGAERVPLGPLVEELVRDGRLEAEARRCHVVSAGQIDGQALGSREMLRRAIENVLRNAIRYAPEGTAVEVTCMESDRAAVIVVRDYGPGVPEESLARIFDPFYRVEEAREKPSVSVGSGSGAGSATKTATKSGGSGLGLAIARRAMQAHHGAIEAENAHPGLSVRIEIPLVP